VAAFTAPTSPRASTVTYPAPMYSFADQDDVGGLDHGIGRLNGADQAARFNHAEGVCTHVSQLAKAPQG
jgi:hypothetical protein